MIITYQGDNYFKVQSGDLAILIDPENQRSIRGAVVALSTQKPSNIQPSNEDNCFFIDHQGEYEVKGIHMTGWSAGYENGKEKTIYKIVFDEISIGVLGYITKEPNEEIQEYLEDVDILIVPAGGKPYISQTALAKFVRQIEPGIIIPSLYKDVKQFTREFNQTPANEEKLVIKKKDITQNAMKIICLESK